MITEILIRCYTPELYDLQKRIAWAIANHTKLKPIIVDHSKLTLDDFDIGESFPVSLDRHLAQKFNMIYMRVSRVFDTTGEIVDRLTAVSKIDSNDICVIDTDIVLGATIKHACAYLKTKKYSVPIIVDKHQDLIDIEDLVFEESILKSGQMCSYMINEEFFAKRTSLPVSLYPIIKEMINV